MTLVNRVSTFFLVALGVSLLGCSLLMWMLIRHHLYNEFDAKLRHALGVLVAAVEVEADSVKWQPSDHTLLMGDDPESDEVRWLLLTADDQIIDQSGNMQVGDASDAELRHFLKREHSSAGHCADCGHWRVVHQSLSVANPKPAAELDPDEFAELDVLVGRDSSTLNADLLKLNILVIAVPSIVWLVAVFVGRAFCRRALMPVQHMADRALSTPASSFDIRLPVSKSQDELSALANAFNGLLDRLQQSYHQQQRFTGDAAHQLRTPLTILRGEIDLSLRRPRTAEEYRNVLLTLSDQTASLQEIVEALLFLARATGESVVPEQRTVQLAEWLPAFLQRWESHPRFFDLSSRITGRPVLTTSIPLLQQLLENLISNAFKYSPAGSSVLVEVTGQQQGKIEIRVQDQGEGIAAEDLPSIFDPFFRSASARRSGVAGTGLGLSIVSQLAETLGGTVRCESESGLGACFILQLPGAQDVPVEDEIAVAAASH